MQRSTPVALLLICLLLIASCDSAEPAPPVTPEIKFESPVAGQEISCEVEVVARQYGGQSVNRVQLYMDDAFLNDYQIAEGPLYKLNLSLLDWADGQQHTLKARMERRGGGWEEYSIPVVVKPIDLNLEYEVVTVNGEYEGIVFYVTPDCSFRATHITVRRDELHRGIEMSQYQGYPGYIGGGVLGPNFLKGERMHFPYGAIPGHEPYPIGGGESTPKEAVLGSWSVDMELATARHPDPPPMHFPSAVIVDF